MCWIKQKTISNYALKKMREFKFKGQDIGLNYIFIFVLTFFENREALFWKCWTEKKKKIFLSRLERERIKFQSSSFLPGSGVLSSVLMSSIFLRRRECGGGAESCRYSPCAVIRPPPPPATPPLSSPSPSSGRTPTSRRQRPMTWQTYSRSLSGWPVRWDGHEINLTLFAIFARNIHFARGNNCGKSHFNVNTLRNPRKYIRRNANLREFEQSICSSVCSSA